MASSPDGGFTVVDRRKAKSKKKAQRNCPILTDSNSPASTEITFQELEVLMDRARFELTTEPDFLTKVTNDVCAQLSDRKTRVVCYGIGNFSSSEVSRYQLWLLDTLLTQLQLDACEIYDPKFTEVEKCWLKNRQPNKFRLLESNDAACCSHSIDTETENLQNLFAYMPHCGRPMYNNILWTNWSPRLLKKLVIFGNSFTTIPINTSESGELQYLFKAKGVCREVKVMPFQKCYKAFNDCSLISFPPEFDTLDGAFWDKSVAVPKYSTFANEIIL